MVAEMGEQKYTTQIRRSASPVWDERWDWELPSDHTGTGVAVRFRVRAPGPPRAERLARREVRKEHTSSDYASACAPGLTSRAERRERSASWRGEKGNTALRPGLTLRSVLAAVVSASAPA